MKKMNSTPGKPSTFLFCAPKHKETLYLISRKGLISCMTVDGNAKISFVAAWYINILEAQSEKRKSAYPNFPCSQCLMHVSLTELHFIKTLNIFSRKKNIMNK